MRKLFFLLAASVILIAAKAQTEGTQYFMRSLPQVSINNPAFIPAYQYSIGLPGISSVAAGYTNNGFSYNDLIYRDNGVTKADINGWNSALLSKNYITTASQVDLLRVGFRTNHKIYFQISSTARHISSVMLPDGLTTLIAQGNASLAGASTQFSPRAEGTAWIETALAVAYSPNQKLTFGVRLKYLKGLMNVTTIRSDLGVSIASDYSATASADVLLRTSGVYDVSQSGYSFKHEFKNYMSNNGAAIDLGATFQITEKLSLAASLVDIGQIHWKNNTYDYQMDKANATYTFAGIDADKLIRGDKHYLSEQADSIKKHFVFKKNASGAYNTWLPGKMYVSGKYALTKNFSAGLLIVSEKYRDHFSQSTTAALIKNFGKTLSTTVSYTVSSHSYNNFGAGLSLNVRPFQFYLVGDNLLNAPVALITTQKLNSYLNNTQAFSLRAGLNFVWGLEKKQTARVMPAIKQKARNRVHDIRRRR